MGEIKNAENRRNNIRFPFGAGAGRGWHRFGYDFLSGQLTQLVKKYAPEFITCEKQLGKAELTLFKAFPNVGVDIVDVALINPMEGSPSDTLANIDNLIVVVDAKKRHCGRSHDP